MPTLGVNIDHVATVREARKTTEPDPVWAAALAELGGADQITVHLREDRRHVQDRDVRLLRETVNVRLNMECACIEEMLGISCELKPHQVCLVPEKREEVTTEGGLDVIKNRSRVGDSIAQLQESGILVSLFIDPDASQIAMAAELGAEAIELHTGTYSLAQSQSEIETQLGLLVASSKQGNGLGLRVDAGHGLTYTNVLPVAQIAGMAELNIGHSIVSRALFVGFQQAVREMKTICESVR
ncbi:MAG: pyridoxine 5-phosphate synthase [Mariniblastus sp.]|jgi:pyridoxine 5-phosphate synthase